MCNLILNELEDFNFLDIFDRGENHPQRFVIIDSLGNKESMYGDYITAYCAESNTIGSKCCTTMISTSEILQCKPIEFKSLHEHIQYKVIDNYLASAYDINDKWIEEECLKHHSYIINQKRFYLKGHFKIDISNNGVKKHMYLGLFFTPVNKKDGLEITITEAVIPKNHPPLSKKLNLKTLQPGITIMKRKIRL